MNNFSPSDECEFIACTKTPLLFEGKATYDCPGSAEYQWEFGDGSGFTGQYACHSFNEPQDFRVQLTVSCPPCEIEKPARVTVHVIAVEIQVNNTATTDDDVVQLKCEHPSHRHKVPCRARVRGTPNEDVTIVLTNPDGGLRFPRDGDKTLTLSLPKNANWDDPRAQFEISGEKQSDMMNDAKIVARMDSESGEICGKKEVTVFWFDAKLSLIQGTDYNTYQNLQTGECCYGPLLDTAVSFQAGATLRPDGLLACSTPQIVNLRVGFMQEVVSATRIRLFSNPYVTWDPGVTSGTATFADTVTEEETLEPPLTPANDGLDPVAHPLYDISSFALKPPFPCPDAGIANSSDGLAFCSPPLWGHFPFPGIGTPIAYAQYQPFDWSILVEFRTYLVICDLSTRIPCALRESTWTADLLSEMNSQHARVSPTDCPATHDPSTGPQANSISGTINLTHGQEDVSYVYPYRGLMKSCP